MSPTRGDRGPEGIEELRRDADELADACRDGQIAAWQIAAAYQVPAPVVERELGLTEMAPRRPRP